MMSMACHYEPSNRRSENVARSMMLGAQAWGMKVKMVPGFERVEGDIGVAYGWAHPRLFDAYRLHGGHFVYVDLGWWDRKPDTDVLGGYHKVVVDGREPNAYFRQNMPSDRFAQLGQKVRPWRADGLHIIVAGMSEKSANTRGFQPQQWETSTIKALRKIYPKRPIMYRPKPSWSGASQIQGAGIFPAAAALKFCFTNAWAVVCCHSNVSVDALLAGIPMHVQGGVAKDFSTALDQFDAWQPQDGRDQLMADIAYCQWRPKEMASGACLNHLATRTPICG
jgi:hypothetical protein